MSLYVDTEICKGCGLCVPLCPAQAISMIDEKARIDQKKCTKCLLCVDECPTHAIRQTFEQEVELVEEESSLPYPIRKPPASTRTAVPDYRNDRAPAARDASPFLDLFKKAVRTALDFDTAMNRRGRGGGGKRRRQRGRQKGR